MTDTPSRSRRHDHGADALGPLAARPAAPDQHPLGHVAHRRVVLVGVEAPAPRPVLDQRGAHVLHGRPGIGLGDPDADQRVPVRDGRQPALLHRLGAQVLDPPGRPVEGELAADGRRDVGPGDLLQDDGGLDVTQAHAAPLLPHRDAQQVGRRQGLAQLGGHGARLVGLVGPGRHLALGHIAGELAQRGLVLGLGQQVDRAGVGGWESLIVELGADDADEADALARRAAQVVGQSERPSGTHGPDLAVRRGLPPKLEPALEEHAQSGGADRVAEGLQAAVGIDRQLTVAVERARQHLLPRRAPLGEAQVLHEDELGRREAVVHLGHGQLRPGVGDAGLRVGVGGRAHDLLEGRVVVARGRWGRRRGRRRRRGPSRRGGWRSTCGRPRRGR